MKIEKIQIESLSLDLTNFRTLPQENEKEAVNTMISVSPNSYWALFNSILENGYFGTENIIVIEKDGKYIVKEGNRRVSVLKLIYGTIPDFNLDSFYVSKIKQLSKSWLAENKTIPCILYQDHEMDKVNYQISLIHGKDEKASRDRWKAIAKARFSRDINGKEELGLDLFDKYLENNFEISDAQKKKWSGTFPLTILDEALQRVSNFLNYSSLSLFVRDYPENNKELIDSIVFDIGNDLLDFKHIRSDSFLRNDKYFQLVNFDFSSNVTNSNTNKTGKTAQHLKENTADSSNISNNEEKKNKQKRQPLSHNLNDQHSVRKVLRTFKPHGIGNEKVVTLRDEMLQLDIKKNPLAFCFLLRSMIEISLKSFSENNPEVLAIVEKKDKNRDRPLKEIITDAISFFENSDVSNKKRLYPAKATLANTDGLLSVTSLNQLIHNQRFSLSSVDVCVGFHNVFPLIELLNS